MSCSSVSYNHVFGNIQSSLPSAVQESNINLLKECIDFKASESIKSCIEASVRAYLMKNVCKGQSANLNEIKTIVKICIEGTKQDLCLPTLAVHILADAFDCISITQCEELFCFVEENVSVWKSDVFFASCKNQVLRMCNDVLRRLSRSQNTIFCGRILLFLARFFPFSERSGLNLVSEFNLENVTNFTDLEPESGDVEMIPVDEEKAKAVIDHTLYTKFWSLQDFFKNPVQCFQKTQWKIFTKYSEHIFDAFSSFKLESIQSKKSKSSTQHYAISATETKSQCFPKYLTNQELLDLQFADSNFRRYVLLQMLILGHYLTANVKFKQKTLTADQVSWIESMIPKAYNLLSETPPNGQFFVEAVKHIFKREDLWSEWKNSGCPEEKKSKEPAAVGKRLKTDETTGAPVAKKQKRKLGDVIKEADANNSYVMGNPEMTRLWNICPDNFEACKQKNRQFVPTLQEYFEVANEMYQKKGIKVTAEELSNDSNFAWKALRLLILKSPQLFSNTMLFTLQDYISDMLKTSHKDAEAQKMAAKLAVEEDEDKVITDINSSDVVNDDEEDEEENTPRESFTPIQPEEINKLAAALNRKPATAWTSLGKKLGFDADELDYFQTEGKTKLKAIAIMLERWVENEKEEANQSYLTYTLEGLKMDDVSKNVFG